MYCPFFLNMIIQYIKFKGKLICDNPDLVFHIYPGDELRRNEEEGFVYIKRGQEFLGSIDDKLNPVLKYFPNIDHNYTENYGFNSYEEMRGW